MDRPRLIILNTRSFAFTDMTMTKPSRFGRRSQSGATAAFTPFARATSGQTATWLAAAAMLTWITLATAQERPPALVVTESNRPVPLAISQVDVDVRILGFVAETRMTLVFHNRQNRALAGDLYFPLPVGATVSGYALDINGAMVDGVIVDKDKGRQVFEKEVRKGVDPGLVEWIRGNQFKTHVFPIPPRGNRTVRVSYVSDIQTLPGGSSYSLPLHFREKLDAFHLRIEVAKAPARPTLQPGTVTGIDFTPWRDSFVAEGHGEGITLTGDLVVNLPQVEQGRVLVEKASDGQYYFCVNEFPADPRKEASAGVPALSQLTVFWDASGSRGGSDHRRELDFLKAWFGRYASKTLTVNLVPFRNALAPAQRFEVKGGDASPLLAAIGALDYDGGTQIGCLTNFPAPAPGGGYFLFTDGFGNFGAAEPPALDAPLYIFSGDATLDQPFLQYLAERSSGAFFPLRQMTDPQVFAAMLQRPFSFLRAEGGTAETADLCPPTARPIHGRFTLAGKLTAAQARLVLNYGDAGKTLTRSTVTVAKAGAAEGDLLRRLWAQQRLESLLVFEKNNAAEITELGKQYGLVTPFTSLLVLERLEQYVEHHVTPPASLPKLRAEYARIMEERGAETKRLEPGKIEHILALWKSRVEWWERKYAYPENFKVNESKGDQGIAPPPGLASPAPVRVTEIPAHVLGGATRNSVAPASPMRPVPESMPSAPAADTAVNAPTPSPTVPASGFSLAYRETAIVAKARPGRDSAGEAEPGVAIKEWDPKTPYLQALKKAAPEAAFAVYLAQRKHYGTSPAFFLDCAEFFRRAQQEDTAVQVLSNIAELELDNAPLIRVLAYRLLQMGRLDLACGLFEQVLRLRPEEPQSFRDLALALARRGQARNSAADCRRAMELLAKVVNHTWERFDEIEVVALMELNAQWADFTRRFPAEKARFPVDTRLEKLLDLDLRIVLTWDADMTDVDLHVIEPSGERAFYQHNRTTIGGLVSHDFTQGYGPEEYCLRRAMHGSYKIEANYYGSQSARLMGPVTVQAEVITHFGRPNEKRKSLTLRLAEQKETVAVGEVEF